MIFKLFEKVYYYILYAAMKHISDTSLFDFNLIIGFLLISMIILFVVKIVEQFKYLLNNNHYYYDDYSNN